VNPLSDHSVAALKAHLASDGKATRLRLWDFSSAPMRAFHLSWFAFFVSFMAWFGIAPLMAIVRDDLKLTKAQIGNSIIASVAITIFAFLLDGYAIGSDRDELTLHCCFSVLYQLWELVLPTLIIRFCSFG
jgi:hypothetical protein